MSVNATMPPISIRIQGAAFLPGNLAVISVAGLDDVVDKIDPDDTDKIIKQKKAMWADLPW